MHCEMHKVFAKGVNGRLYVALKGTKIFRNYDS